MLAIRWDDQWFAFRRYSVAMVCAARPVPTALQCVSGAVAEVVSGTTVGAPSMRGSSAAELHYSLVLTSPTQVID